MDRKELFLIALTAEQWIEQIHREIKTLEALIWKIKEELEEEENNGI